MTKKQKPQLSADIAADGGVHINVDWQMDDVYTIKVRVV